MAQGSSEELESVGEEQREEEEGLQVLRTKSLVFVDLAVETKEEEGRVSDLEVMYDIEHAQRNENRK